MKIVVIVCASISLVLGASSLQAATQAGSAPDTPERVLNEMKGPPLVMQQELRQLLQPEINRGDIIVHESKDRVEISLSSRALFDSGSDVVHDQGVDILMRIGSVLKTAPNWETTITGHADNQPIRPALQRRFANNMELSEARAKNGSKVLMEAGVDPMLIKTVGKGESQPVASNATAQGRSRNRRIEIVTQPHLPVDPSVVAAQ